MSEFEITIPEEKVVDTIQLKGKNKTTTVTVMEILQAAGVSEDAGKQIEAVQLHLLNKYQIKLEPILVSVMLNHADEVYSKVKKNYTSLPASEDTDTTPTDSAPSSNESS